MNFDASNAPLWLALGLMAAFEVYQLFRRPSVHAIATAPLRPLAPAPAPASAPVVDLEYQAAKRVIQQHIQARVAAEVAAEVIGGIGG